MMAAASNEFSAIQHPTDDSDIDDAPSPYDQHRTSSSGRIHHYYSEDGGDPTAHNGLPHIGLTSHSPSSDQPFSDRDPAGVSAHSARSSPTATTAVAADGEPAPSYDGEAGAVGSDAAIVRTPEMPFYSDGGLATEPHIPPSPSPSVRNLPVWHGERPTFGKSSGAGKASQSRMRSRQHHKRLVPRSAPQDWVRITATGEVSPVVGSDKGRLAAKLGLHARDLRFLDPALASSYPAAILDRDNAILVNLEFIKTIITTDFVIIVNPEDEHVPLLISHMKAISRPAASMIGSSEAGALEPDAAAPSATAAATFIDKGYTAAGDEAAAGDPRDQPSGSYSQNVLGPSAASASTTASVNPAAAAAAGSGTGSAFTGASGFSGFAGGGAMALHKVLAAAAGRHTNGGQGEAAAVTAGSGKLQPLGVSSGMSDSNGNIANSYAGSAGGDAGSFGGDGGKGGGGRDEMGGNGNGNGYGTYYSSSCGSIELPFELKALEVCLELMAQHVEKGALELELSGYPAVDTLRSRVGFEQLDQVRLLKNKLSRMQARTEMILKLLQAFLDDDIDMHRLNLTAEEASRQASLAGSVEGSGSDNTFNSGDEAEIGVVEMLLEAYFMHIDKTWHRLETLDEYIKDMEDLVNTSQDKHRNLLTLLNLLFMAMFGGLTVMVTVTGLFAMNLDNAVTDEHPDAIQSKHGLFWLITSLSTAGGVVFFGIVYLVCYLRKLV